jgi:hypothetical protein
MATEPVHGVEAGQAALRHRARCNSAARAGTWTPEMERFDLTGSVL